MNIYAKHLILKSFLTSLFVWLTMVCLDFSVSFVTELENLSSTNSFISILFATLIEQPHKGLQYLESSMLIGALIALTIFNQQGNLVFLRSLGFSPSKIILITGIGPLLLSLILVTLDEFVFVEISDEYNIVQTIVVDKNYSDDKGAYSWQLTDQSLIGIQSLGPNKISDIQVIQFNDTGEVSRAQKFNSGVLQDNQLSITDSKEPFLQPEIFTFLLQPSLDQKTLERSSLRSLLNLQTKYSSLVPHNDLRLIKSAIYSKIFLPIFVMGIIYFAGSLMFGIVRSGGIGRQIVFGIFFGLLFDLTKDLFVASFLTYQWPILIAYLIPILCLIVGGWAGYRRI
ncbi:LptF/LptG family permease [Gammaproteobacteria bacterium]|nr:LptF/LptG family permease [Gammaproteobacteria bacterium]